MPEVLEEKNFRDERVCTLFSRGRVGQERAWTVRGGQEAGTDEADLLFMRREVVRSYALEIMVILAVVLILMVMAEKKNRESATNVKGCTITKLTV